MDSVAVPGSFIELAGRLLLATLFGALVGLNREQQGKPAGLRTHALVALGGAQLAIVALLFGQEDSSAPGRVLQGVLAGVGFIGVAAGAGLWRTASTALALTMLVLIAGEATDRWLHRDKSPDLIEKPPS